MYEWVIPKYTPLQVFKIQVSFEGYFNGCGEVE